MILRKNMIHKGKKLHDVEMFNLADDNSPFIYKEAYRNIRTNLEFLTFSDEKKVIAVTSSISGEGKTCISINLAFMFAKAGKKVLLIDADLRKPSVHKYLRLINKVGLTSVIYGKIDPDEEFIISLENEGFDVLLSGSKVPNPSEVLSSSRMEKIISSLNNNYDYIIIDTPPIGVVTDAAIVSKIVDGMVYVVKQNYATKNQVLSAYKNLKNVDAKVLGVVLSQYDFDKDNKSVSGEYYSNYYSSYYDTE